MDGLRLTYQTADWWPERRVKGEAWFCQHLKRGHQDVTRPCHTVSMQQAPARHVALRDGVPNQGNQLAAPAHQSSRSGELHTTSQAHLSVCAM